MHNSANSVKVTPKDIVTLHCLGRGKTVPSPSPFVLKLETFLRMAEIDYQIDTKKPFNPKSGKTPWITLNGADLTDTQIIIEHLSKNFEKDLWGEATSEERAIARMTRLTLENHFYWGMVHWRWVKSINTIGNLMPIPVIKLTVAKLVMPRKMKHALNVQGLGRYSYEKMVEFLKEDLRNLSTILGQKDFWLGIAPMEIDCTIFGFLAQVLWGMPGSPYEKLLKDELFNLEEYCNRMREKYYSDFSEILYQPAAKQ